MSMYPGADQIYFDKDPFHRRPQLKEIKADSFSGDFDGYHGDLWFRWLSEKDEKHKTVTISYSKMIEILELMHSVKGFYLTIQDLQDLAEKVKEHEPEKEKEGQLTWDEKDLV